MDLQQRVVDYALSLGADYAATMYHTLNSATITAENGILKSFEASEARGLGIRTIVDGAVGIASSTVLQFQILKKNTAQAVRMAKAARGHIEASKLAEAEPLSASVKSPWKTSPEKVSDEEKIRLVLEANRAASLDGIKNYVTYLGWLTERRVFASSEGAQVERELMMTGLGQLAVAEFEGRMESVSDSRSRCAGFEFISDMDCAGFAREVAQTANRAVRARAPKGGNYPVVADPDLIGLILHEALGHGAEGDLVTTRESVLEGKLGQPVASPLVTIADEGVVEDGYYLPFDDEGIRKTRSVVVEKGILKGYLQSRSTASKLGTASTGNARAQSFAHRPIVRQTNFLMEGGDSEVEELFEGVQDGFYICGRGARGGEVDVGQGTFTFRAGPSFAVRKGEVAEMVRGVSLSGMVLDALNQISAVGKDVKVRTSIFGGCGKDGQRAHVGHGGPHVRFERMSIGGSS